MEPLVTKDIFTIVSNQIIQKLEQGVIPWKQPWKNAGPPINLLTRRLYRGINYLLLNSLGYAESEFLTFKQVQDLGGRVKKGEKANLVILWVWVDESKRQQSIEVVARTLPLLRYYHVFNVTQCTGIPARSVVPLEQKQNDPIKKCEAIIEAMPNRPNIVYNENMAYYHTLADFINMPKMAMFESGESYYATLFHELIHSTGYIDRLNRKEITEENNFGSESYSIEELTAEIGTCYLTSYAGIAMNGLENNIAYIHGWLERLKQDKRFIVYASAHAQKAVDYILNVKHDENNVVEHLQNEVV
jgi:antirestriction protein ArdC